MCMKLMCRILSVVTGIAMPLMRSNVDTDQIIPAVFLKRVTRTGFDDALFYAWRQDPVALSLSLAADFLTMSSSDIWS